LSGCGWPGRRFRAPTLAAVILSGAQRSRRTCFLTFCGKRPSAHRFSFPRARFVGRGRSRPPREAEIASRKGWTAGRMDGKPPATIRWLPALEPRRPSGTGRPPLDLPCS
jgi:hypothetical protein